MNFAFSVCIVKEFKSSGCAGLMCLPNWIFYVSQWLQYGHPVLVPIIIQLSRACCVCAAKIPGCLTKESMWNPYLQRGIADQISFGVAVRRENHLESIQRSGEPIVLTAYQNHSRPSANDSDSSILGELPIDNQTSEGPQIPKAI